MDTNNRNYGRDGKELVCTAQTKLTINQSNLLDEMARVNNTTRSYELRMILELYGRDRLNLEDDRRELVEAEKACMSLYELYQQIYPVKDAYSSVPWYTGIHLLGVGFVGLLELEMVNKNSRNLLFRYTKRFFPPIQKRYPEIAVILEKVIDMTDKQEVQIEAFL